MPMQSEDSIHRDVVSVRHLSRRFGNHDVLRDISLSIKNRETVAIMGASGGGKTTLLRCLSGLLQPSSGVVELFGVDINQCSERQLDEIRRKTGVVFQGAALFDYMTVGENVAFGVVRQKRMSRSEVNELVEHRLGIVGLQGTAHLMPSELSGGMRKRVGLARALATEPEILFYDEPTSGLDPITAFSIDGLIREVANTTQTTSVMVTHDIRSAMRVANRVLYLYEGQIVLDGVPELLHTTDDPHIQELVHKAETESLS